MQHKINRAVQAYFEAIVEHKILEKDIKRVEPIRGGVILTTDKKFYYKIIRNHARNQEKI